MTDARHGVALDQPAMLLRAGHVQDRLVTALQEQATVDSLTGLVNRRVFERQNGTRQRQLQFHHA